MIGILIGAVLTLGSVDVVIDEALVVRARAKTQEVKAEECKRVPLRNGRVGETVMMCETVRGER